MDTRNGSIGNVNSANPSFRKKILNEEQKDQMNRDAIFIQHIPTQ